VNAAPIVTPEMLARLPTSVQRYVNFSGVVRQPQVQTVIVAQTGKIRLGPEKRWMQFKATESYSVDPPSWSYPTKGAARETFRLSAALLPPVPSYDG
jgi:hypothetical protein